MTNQIRQQTPPPAPSDTLHTVLAVIALLSTYAFVGTLEYNEAIGELSRERPACQRDATDQPLLKPRPQTTV